MAHESIPLKPPAPYIHPFDSFVDEAFLSSTSEKTCKQTTTCKKKVSFVDMKENLSENMLAKPVLHTSNLLKREIRKCQENSDLSQVLKEIQLSENVQEALNKEAARLLNYKINDQKYTNLVSLETDLKPPILKKRTKLKFLERKKDETFKPDIMEFWNPEDFITEKPKTDYKVSLYCGDNHDEENKCFDYLLDTYRRLVHTYT